MTAKEIYGIAMNQLGYSDNTVIQKRAVPIINKIFLEMSVIFNPEKTFTPIKSLGDTIDLPDDVTYIVIPLGVAAGIAVGEGDGELQQFFASEYDRARKRYSKSEVVEDIVY